IDCVVVSEEVGVRKPDAEIFRIAADRLGIAPARSWFIGDNPTIDIVGARDAGFRAIWLRGTRPWPDGQPHCYAASAGSIDDALAFAEASFRSGRSKDEEEKSGAE
ncbi:MAG TPA: HAD family hydrolase, partial [Pseudomonadales bacterium]